jgi:Phorbol esters/diacylglycerol binding domain (C1 domain)
MPMDKEDDERNRLKMRDCLQLLGSQPRNGRPSSPKAHEFLEKKNSFTSFSNCGVCRNSMMGNHYQCAECGLVCHQKCKDTAPLICGGVGNNFLIKGHIRLKITHTVHAANVRAP